MSTTTLMTAEELLRYPEEGFRHELIRGVLHRLPLRVFADAVVVSEIMHHLYQHVKDHQLGTVVGGCGFELESNPDTVQAPAVAYLSRERIKRIKDRGGYPDFAPDLVIEVLSLGDSIPKLVQKCEGWLQAGALAAVIVNPRRKTATLYQTEGQPIEFSGTDSLMVSSVVPGWKMPVREMFEIN